MLAFPTVRALVLWDSEEALRHQFSKRKVLRLDIHDSLIVSPRMSVLDRFQDRSDGLLQIDVLLNHLWLRSHCCLLLPLAFLFTFIVGRALARGISSSARRFASILTWEYRDSMARETCPAMLMITSAPRPGSECSETGRSLSSLGAYDRNRSSCAGIENPRVGGPWSRAGVGQRWSATCF